MKFKLNRNLQIGFGSAIIILIIVGIVSYVTLQNLLASNRAVAHSNLVIEKLERTLSVMKDAETGQRGYLLSGDTRFLEPYNGASQHALGLIAEAKALTADNIVQQINMSSLNAILVHRLNVLQKVIDKKQHNEAILPSDLSTGKIAMDTLRGAISKAEQDERRLLARHTLMLNRYVVLTPLAILFAIGLAIIISLFSYYSVTRDLKTKDRLQKELYEKERETAAFNKEVTAANEEIAASNEELMTINGELAVAQQNLAELNSSLEDKVLQRTRALMNSEEEMQVLNEELTAINEELAAANEEMLATNEELDRSRHELQKSSALFKSIAVNIPRSLIMVLDTDQRLITIEGELMNQMAYDSPDYIGKQISEVMPADRYAATRHLYERVLAGIQFSEERKSSDGSMDLRVDFVPLRDDRQVIYAALIIALDISDIKQAEERSAKLAAIVESSDDAIISKTLDGVVTSWNQSAERLFGYAAADMIGQLILRLIPADRLDEEPHIIKRLKAGERIQHFETLRVTKAGQLLDVSLTISPIKDAQGKIIGASKIVRDISERKRDDIRKNDFIGMVSHELKTPLTSLTALIQAANIKLRTSEDPFLANAMDKANIQTRKMAAMVNGFLNISRLESGQIQINREEVDVEELLENAVHEMELSVTSHKISFTRSRPVMVDADPDKIGSVISNLLNNAVKYSSKGTHIDIQCIVSANGAQVSVRDEGIGIKPEDKGRLFERFYRVEGEHTRHISGFGIGLYLSAEIIQRHGGKIWVESEFGSGSTFYFSLPLK